MSWLQKLFGGTSSRQGAQSDNIHVSAQDGDLVAVQRILSAGRQSVSSRDSMQRTPFHRAARGGQVQVMQFLLENGAYINARDEYQWTPLHMAAEANKPEAVKFLIDRKADISARDSDLRTALHRAAEYNSVDAIKVLLEASPATLIPAGDSTRMTAKAVAKAMDHQEAIAMIEKYE